MINTPAKVLRQQQQLQREDLGVSIKREKPLAIHRLDQRQALVRLLLPLSRSTKWRQQ